MTASAIRFFNLCFSPLVELLLFQAGYIVVLMFIVLPMLFSYDAYIWCGACGLWYLVAITLRSTFPAEDSSSHIRGSSLRTEDELRERWDRAGRKPASSQVSSETESSAPRGRPFNWFGQYVPESDANKGFFAVGTPSSGKSLVLLMLLKSVLKHFGSSKAKRILIYDAKRDMVPCLTSAGLRIGTDILILHPFDSRGVAWDIAADVRNESEAREVASTFVVTTARESQPFFPNCTLGDFRVEIAN